MDEDPNTVYPVQFMIGLLVMLFFASIVHIGLYMTGIVEVISWEHAVGIWLIALGYTGLKL